MLRYLTAGESHGPGLTAIIDGVPAGLSLTPEEINRDLGRRQLGYGRGGRMKIEKDTVEISAGVRFGRALGSPLALTIRNRDWENWKVQMSLSAADAATAKVVTNPRPGHADLAGAIKYGHEDIRNVLERASARETAARVAVGAVAKTILRAFGIQVCGYVVELGGVRASFDGLPLDELYRRSEASDLRCADPEAERQMRERIDEAKRKGDTVGGIFEVVAAPVPPGLGSHVQWDRKLDGRLARSLMSIQAIKGVEIGLGFEVGRRFGSEVHDEIFYEPGRGFYRKTNSAGGLEGGITNGEPIVVRAAMKPLSTLMSPLMSVDLVSKAPSPAKVERSDVCSLPAAAVVGEAAVAFELADAFLEKFGGDSIEEVRRNYESYQAAVRAR
ncbi:MAG: chorismate synthase [Deltaproteobacteria bacterium]|nr:chorismate synthase [Deltaproteobacteria bacterium]MBI3077300.1 chorismate synthase [Deltaproteobacteria bacterium]